MAEEAAPPKNAVSEDEFVEQINSAADRNLGSVFEIGDLLRKAEEEISDEAFERVIERSAVGSRKTASNYMRVSKSPDLRTPEIQPYLPMGVGTLIDLAAWKRDELEEAIRQEKLHRAAARSDLKKWIKEHRLPKPRTEAAKRNPLAGMEIVFHVAVSREFCDFEKACRLRDLLEKIESEFNPGDIRIAENPEAAVEHIPGLRRESLLRRILALYAEKPEFFDDPDLRARLGGSLPEKHLDYFVQRIAAREFKSLRKELGFTRRDWKFLGVKNMNYATLSKVLADDSTQS